MPTGIYDRTVAAFKSAEERFWPRVSKADEERRRWRMALGLPPDMPAETPPPSELETFLQERLGPLAVPTGTREKPPVPPMYGPDDRRSRNKATAKTIPPGLQRAADIVSPPGSPSRKVFSVLGAMSTVDPERDVAAELQQAHPIEKIMMSLPIGAPVGSLAGTAGKGVLRQLGGIGGRAIETGGVSAGIPRTAQTVAARARPLTPGRSVPKRPGPVAIPGLPGERSMPLTKPGVSRPLTPRPSRPKQLSEAEERLRELGEQRAIAEVRLELLQSSSELKKPPANAKHGLGLWSPSRLKALAIHEGLDYRKADWWDSIDSVVVKEMRNAKVAQQPTVASLNREIRALRAEEKQLGGTIQSGMGIGERPAQGGLFENLRGEAERIPLADTEQMALRQARAAEIARGQAEMPLTKPVASEALGPAAKPAQATEGVIPEAPVGARRTPQQVPESVEKLAAAPEVAPTGAKAAEVIDQLKVVLPRATAADEIAAILPDGTPLAFQDAVPGSFRMGARHEGGPEVPRIAQWFDAGVIRTGLEENGTFYAEIRGAITPQQRATLGRFMQDAPNVVVDIAAADGTVIKTLEGTPNSVRQQLSQPPVGARRTPQQVPESVEKLAAAPEVTPTGTKAAAAQAPSPAAAAPPGQPPARPPAPPTGGVPPTSPVGPNIPPYVEPPMMGKNVLGMKPIQAGLSKLEEIANIARRTVGKVGVRLVEDNPLVSGAFKERARLRSVADSQAGRLATKHGAQLGKVFTLDKQGRVTNLAGVDATLPGAPTIQDVAARLPRYWDNLTSEQQQAMLALRQDVTPYRSLLEEVGVEVPARADVIEGGFYLPRGRADLEGADLPLKVGTGLGRGGKKGFERPAVFESQTVGIDAGYEYPPITDTLAAYARDAGNRATDAHIATFFKTATDETGQLLGNTPKMRLMQQNPAVAAKMQALKDSLDRLKRLSASLTNRQLEVIDKWQLDPTFDDLDVLLDGLKTMRGGRGAGMTAPEMQTALTSTRQAIRALAPEYKVALRRAQATPRLEGAVGLPGLQGWAFPDEIANAANLILKGEGPPRGLAAKPIAVANAFNNLYRGTRATLDNSAIGIQGLLGAADDPVAYAKAVGVNLRAWGPGGEAALGKYISQFDEASAKAGRLTSDDWARATLRIGGAQTEFQLGAGVSEKLSRLPLVRQANRAFGYFGDALRLDWADDMLAAELRRGKSIQELWDAGDVERIAGIANNMTGWAAGKAFGSMGDLLLFAPRFLESRAETVVKGVAGLRPGASIEQRAARRSLLKMIGYGAIITVAANEMLGNETDFNPIIKVRRKNDWQYTWNPNFMRVRFAGRDWSIYGTWDSFARAITVTAMGRPQEALRGLGSGTLTAAWDIIGNRDFDYQPVRDTPAHFGAWLLESMLPFSVPQTVALGKEGVAAAQKGDVKQAAGAVVATGLQLQGAKSSPLTLKDKLGITDEELAPYFDITPKDDSYAAAQAATKTRAKLRASNPEIDAKLFITGQVDAPSTMRGFTAAVRLMKENGISIEEVLPVEKAESPTRIAWRRKFEAALGIVPASTTAPKRPITTPTTQLSPQEIQAMRLRLGLPASIPTPVGAR